MNFIKIKIQFFFHVANFVYVMLLIDQPINLLFSMLPFCKNIKMVMYFHYGTLSLIWLVLLSSLINYIHHYFQESNRNPYIYIYRINMNVEFESVIERL
jgi:hypothetical protein